MQNTEIFKIVQLVWPIALIQLALQVYAIVDLIKRKKTKNLNVPVWVLIIILGEIIGAVLYFAIGRSEEE